MERALQGQNDPVTLIAGGRFLAIASQTLTEQLQRHSLTEYICLCRVELEHQPKHHDE